MRFVLTVKNAAQRDAFELGSASAEISDLKVFFSIGAWTKAISAEERVFMSSR